jgi:curved DNA-binding protein
MARSFGFRGVDDIFKDFYGPGYRSFEFRQFKGNRWQSGRVLFRKDAFSFQKPLGSGFQNFSGRLLKQLHMFSASKKGKDVHDNIILRPDFALTGGPYPYFVKRRSKKLVVKIPPGVQEGQRIRLSGMGYPGKNGGESGDLYLKITLKRSFFQQLKQMFTSFITK